MAKEIYQSVNYLYVDDGVVTNPIRYSRKNSHYRKSATDYIIINRNTQGQTIIPIADVGLWGDPGTADDITGTVNVTNNSTAVVGVGTSFTEQLEIGDAITINAVGYVIDTITDDTNLDLTVVYAGITDTGLALEGPRTFFSESTFDAFLDTHTETI